MGFGKKSSQPQQQTPQATTTVTQAANTQPISRVTGVQQDVANQNPSPHMLSTDTEEQKRASVLGGSTFGTA